MDSNSGSLGTVVVKPGKINIFLFLAVSVAIVTGGVWLLSLGPDELARPYRKFDSPTQSMVAIAIAVLVFGLIAVYLVAKLFDSKPGLKLSSAGITDNASIAVAGLIPWSQVTGLGESKTRGSRTLLVLLKEPKKYVNRSNPVRRFLSQNNLTAVGTPIVISSFALRMRHGELADLCDRYYRQYGFDA